MAHYKLTRSSRGVVYRINVVDSMIEVNGKYMRVVYGDDLCYELGKKKINSSGLPEFFSDYGKNIRDYELSGKRWAGAYEVVCEHVLKYGKAV